MANHFCKTCLYYRQHYTFDQSKIFRVYCGHCTYQKVKTKRPDAKACENYLLSESAENAFVAKEYLSKQAFWQAIFPPDGAKILSVFILELLAKNASVATLALLAVSEIPCTPVFRFVPVFH